MILSIINLWKRKIIKMWSSTKCQAVPDLTKAKTWQFHRYVYTSICSLYIRFSKSSLFECNIYTMLGHPNTLKLCTAQDVNSTMILENSRILRVTRLVFSWLGYGKLQPQIRNFSQKLLVFFSSAL